MSFGSPTWAFYCVGEEESVSLIKYAWDAGISEFISNHRMFKKTIFQHGLFPVSRFLGHRQSLLPRLLRNLCRQRHQEVHILATKVYFLMYDMQPERHHVS